MSKALTISYLTQDGRTITVPAKYQHFGGYPAHPGTGPEGETCGTCQNLVRHSVKKSYLKCGLINWTNGPGTDIRKSSPACKHWEAKP